MGNLQQTDYPVSVQTVIIVPDRMLYKKLSLQPVSIMPRGVQVFSDGGYSLEDVHIRVVTSENETRQLESIASDIRRLKTDFNLHASNTAENPVFKLCNSNDSKCRDLNFVTDAD